MKTCEQDKTKGVGGWCILFFNVPCVERVGHVTGLTRTYVCGCGCTHDLSPPITSLSHYSSLSRSHPSNIYPYLYIILYNLKLE